MIEDVHYHSFGLICMYACLFERNECFYSAQIHQVNQKYQKDVKIVTKYTFEINAILLNFELLSWFSLKYEAAQPFSRLIVIRNVF